DGFENVAFAHRDKVLEPALAVRELLSILHAHDAQRAAVTVRVNIADHVRRGGPPDGAVRVTGVLVPIHFPDHVVAINLVGMPGTRARPREVPTRAENLVPELAGLGVPDAVAFRKIRRFGDPQPALFVERDAAGFVHAGLVVAAHRRSPARL